MAKRNPPPAKAATKKPQRAKGVSPKHAPTAKAASSKTAKDGRDARDASLLIDERIAELGDWRGAMFARLRRLIHEADPEIVEEWKWMGTPVFSHAGIVCTGETYKNIVKMTFAKGAALEDPARLFNSSLEGNVRRAIDFREGEKVNEKALKALIRSAVVLNLTKKPAKR